jgi:CheY-like chemotaxis protein
LVVDDQDENRQLLRQMLEPLGFDVALAGDGQEAADLARHCHPDLVLMDLRMPAMNGFDAAAAIRRLPGLGTVPIVAASASSADLARAEADSDTFARCLRKPFQTEDLLEVIARALGLSWRYVQTEGAGTRDDQPAVAALVLPPQEALEELLELARLGKLVRVAQIAADLEQGSAQLRPFARRLLELAHSFDEDRLVALLQECLETGQDAVSH